MNKRAQLTLTIMTGIVLLFAIGLVIWLGSQVAQRRTAPEAEQQRLRQLAVQPVKDYVQSCLDITTSTALELLGKQGGVLYQSQGGLTADVLPHEEGVRAVEFDDLKVNYAILMPSGQIGEVYFANPPNYPFLTFPHFFKSNDPNTEEIIATQYTGYLGIPKLPPLYKPGPESIQTQLEAAINRKLPECTQWETFRQTQGLEITAGEPNTSVAIAENITQIETEQLFTVFVRWPIIVKDLTTNAETRIEEFSLGYPVHLAKFYHVIQDMVFDEVSNLSSDPRKVSSPATPVTVVDNVFTHDDDKSIDDLVIVQDMASFLRGRPFEFRVLRRNRPPALVWINATDLAKHAFIPMGLCEDKASISLSGKDLMIAWGEPKDWSITLAAVDPDEDSIVFKTYDPTPAKIKPLYAGLEFNLDVCASDGSTIEDCQRLKLKTLSCPTP
jgi:hypothetical protein